MKFVVVALLSMAAMLGQVVPGRYVVELAGDPAAVAAAKQGSRFAARETDFALRRAAVRQNQNNVRTAVANLGGTVLDSMDTVFNGLIVSIPDARAAELAKIPGVVKLYPSRRVQLKLDHALPIHKVPAAWATLPQGQNSAGAGIKIGMLDTGIDVNNPGFSQSLPPVAGFPKVLVAGDTVFTNAKIIVAKNYTPLLPDGGDPDSDDYDGHGSGTAMAAAGGPTVVPTYGTTISGVAPQAYLGSYKVIDANGATTDVIAKGIDDAVADGMDVLNISIGGPVVFYSDADPTSDVEIAAIEAATQAGVIVAVAAGNEGPSAGSLSAEASTPDAISVGAIENDRALDPAITPAGSAPLLAIPGDGPNPGQVISGPGFDVTQLDPSGLACSPLNSGSVSGMVVLVLRGTPPGQAPCTFENKVNNVAAGGALAAVVYDNDPADQVLLASVGNATLPAMFMNNGDGVNLKAQIDANSGLQLSLDFTGTTVFPIRTDLVDFSSRGPSIGSAMKPDLVAVGDNIVTAAQDTYSDGASYDPSGFIDTGGTSFSTPLTAGAAALLKAARPGLTMQQYRSLLINSASPATNGPGVAATVQQAGAGVLNVAAALSGTVAAYPTSLNFGTGPGSINNTLNLVLSNAGTASDTFSIQILPTGNSPALALSANTVQLGPNASGTVSATVNVSGLAPGEYQGYLQVSGTASATYATIPYWFAVPGSDPQGIAILYSDFSDPARTLSTQAIIFRITDVAGLPYTGSLKPTAAISAGGGSLRNLYSIGDIPGTYAIDLRTGTSTMEIDLSVGGVTQAVLIGIF